MKKRRRCCWSNGEKIVDARPPGRGAQRGGRRWGGRGDEPHFPEVIKKARTEWMDHGSARFSVRQSARLTPPSSRTRRRRRSRACRACAARPSRVASPRRAARRRASCRRRPRPSRNRHRVRHPRGRRHPEIAEAKLVALASGGVDRVRRDRVALVDLEVAHLEERVALCERVEVEHDLLGATAACSPAVDRVLTALFGAVVVLVRTVGHGCRRVGLLHARRDLVVDARCNGLVGCMIASVYAFSASRYERTSGLARSRSQNQSSIRSSPCARRMCGARNRAGGRATARGDARSRRLGHGRRVSRADADGTVKRNGSGPIGSGVPAVGGYAPAHGRGPRHDPTSVQRGRARCRRLRRERPGRRHRAGGVDGPGADARVDESRLAAPHPRDRSYLVLEPESRGALVQGRDVGRSAIRAPRGPTTATWTRFFVVEQEGRGACHTGERSCFFRDFGSGATPGPA